MREVDRGLIILQPKQAFVDWVNSWSKDGQVVSLDEACKDNDTILIPEFESEEEAMAYVRVHATELFEHVLENWCRDRSLWPVNRDSTAFLNWFDVELHSLVFDMLGAEQGKLGLN